MTYIPSHLQIEPVNRLCDARCPMCTIKFVPEWEPGAEDDQSFRGVSRRAEVMTLETFQAIASKFTPYVAYIRILSLHGCGESLLDKGLHKKVAFARSLGFREIGFTSNCNTLTKRTTEDLLEAGLNCLIPSVDGVTKQVHEAIRPGTSFDDVIANVKYFLHYRDAGDFPCKVLVRMVRQRRNAGQWEDYTRFWTPLLSAAKGDAVLAIDVHNNGGKVVNFDEMRVPAVEPARAFLPLAPGQGSACLEAAPLEHAGVCPDLFSRMSIFASGDVALCSADQAAFFRLGNVLHDDPMAIFNNETFSRYRDTWLRRQQADLTPCDGCSVTLSRFHKTRH